MYCSKCGTWALDSDTLCSRCGAALQVDREPLVLTAAPAPVPLRQPSYAGFWRRFGTMLVDYMVCFPFGATVRILLGIGVFESLDWTRDSLFVLGFGMLSGWLYDALMESSRWQGTLGQQLLGVRVTDRQGRRVSFARASARHFGQYLSIFTLGIGYLAIAFNRRKLALHDWLSGCELVRGGLEAPDTSALRPVPPVLSPLGGGTR